MVGTVQNLRCDLRTFRDYHDSSGITTARPPSVMVRGHQQHCDTWADTFRYVALYASMYADLDLTCIIWLQMDTISHYPLIHF